MKIDKKQIVSNCGNNTNSAWIKTAQSMNSPCFGLKYDEDKLKYSLLPKGTLTKILEVLTLGANKYAPNNWKNVENPKERYYNAIMRHLDAWWNGEITDPESNKSHLAHIACSVLFLMWFEGRK